MNILFHIDVECVPENGGIERVTSLLTKELRKRGHKVYSSYRIHVDREATRPDFDGVFPISAGDSERLAEIIREHDLDHIVVQKTFRDLPWIRKGIEKSGKNTKIIYCFHSRPSRTRGLHGFKSLVFNDPSKMNLLKIPLKAMLYPIRRAQYEHQQYFWPTKMADKILVLSEQYIEPWLTMSKGAGRGIIEAMPNPLSFDPHTSAHDIKTKHKKVLIVARMEEEQKNFKEALNIWSMIEKNQNLKDWTLEIVGSGPDRDKVEKEAKRFDLKRATFHGYQNPENFYKEASIFMMTSRFEGWPMTINEATQYGCVPVVYTSFSAIHDVVEDGLNGFLVKPYETAEYVKALTNLMKDQRMRERMAQEGVKSSWRFNLGPIIDRWEDLFSDIKTRHMS